ncbi:hypothetical protein [Bacillus sp. FJAT-45037]|uniref:hypothetical protein n=1 Tax=Bacillus sp. FJAT-45037 TaxID=2011007 RepID=UPI000C237258|nr:hypothetical protein [Bacillus sp. FJAT-45037]
MLTFEEKLAIIESFSELERHDVSLGRVNFHYNESASEHKNVVYHLHPNGNGFVYGRKLQGYSADKKGMVNIRDYSETELHTIIAASIDSLTIDPEDIVDEPTESTWINRNTVALTLINEEGTWNVYTEDDQLDGTFTTYSEAAHYLDEEGFEQI